MKFFNDVKRKNCNTPEGRLQKLREKKERQARSDSKKRGY